MHVVTSNLQRFLNSISPIIVNDIKISHLLFQIIEPIGYSV